MPPPVVQPAEQVARGLFADDRTKLEWDAPRVLMPKNKVKLVLNLCLIAAAAIPRGGVIKVTIADPEGALRIAVEATGPNARLASHVPQLLAGTPTGSIDAHGIQAYYTGLVARAADLNLSLSTSAEYVRVEAVPAAAEAMAPAELLQADALQAPFFKGP